MRADECEWIRGLVERVRGVEERLVIVLGSEESKDRVFRLLQDEIRKLEKSLETSKVRVDELENRIEK